MAAAVRKNAYAATFSKDALDHGGASDAQQGSEAGNRRICAVVGIQLRPRYLPPPQAITAGMIPRQGAKLSSVFAPAQEFAEHLVTVPCVELPAPIRRGDATPTGRLRHAVMGPSAAG